MLPYRHLNSEIDLALTPPILGMALTNLLNKFNSESTCGRMIPTFAARKKKAGRCRASLSLFP
jgi:hypothetical protein